MSFAPGAPRPTNAGRRKGSRNKRTIAAAGKLDALKHLVEVIENKDGTITGLVWRWFSGRQKPPAKSEVQFEQRIVDLLAEELAENEPPAELSLIDTPKLQPKRPRRRDVGL